MTTTTTPKFQLPAGAVDVDAWEIASTAPDGLPIVYRGFDGSERVVDRPDYKHDIAIGIGGRQYLDGDVTRNVFVVTPIDGPAEARQFAGALIAAADECERYDAIEAGR
ncbi:hypothetical protein [Mycobacterium palustre]|uniref:Uncharacterized protein n=1 Tax=Mycobacterium palustre TaxID=153971 RepID=A0A1X1ZVQ7_9MYCO|nr:hypothetical protein [Mycobacterium palustre]MCV7101550.1 hypothetical protein [Mycobacterium palustre]ORW28193.1 hypothetical protein AWC19_27550 [Mycobacterium palustre]